MPGFGLSRRRLVATTGAVLALAPAGARAALAPTPAQSAGPFYPLELPLDRHTLWSR